MHLHKHCLVSKHEASMSSELLDQDFFRRSCIDHSNNVSPLERNTIASKYHVLRQLRCKNVATKFANFTPFSEWCRLIIPLSVPLRTTSVSTPRAVLYENFCLQHTSPPLPHLCHCQLATNPSAATTRRRGNLQRTVPIILPAGRGLCTCMLWLRMPRALRAFGTEGELPAVTNHRLQLGSVGVWKCESAMSRMSWVSITGHRPRSWVTVRYGSSHRHGSARQERTAKAPPFSRFGQDAYTNILLIRNPKAR